MSLRSDRTSFSLGLLTAFPFFVTLGRGDPEPPLAEPELVARASILAGIGSAWARAPMAQAKAMIVLFIVVGWKLPVEK